MLEEESFKITEGGVSLYRILREGDFSYDVTEKYHRDVKELIFAKLDALAHEYAVPGKKTNRIKQLIDELLVANEILTTYDCTAPEIKKSPELDK